MRGASRRGEDGALIAFGLIVLLIMLMAAGLAVDTMRHERERALMQATLDRAVVAAADLEQRIDPKEVVTNYFELAGVAHTLGEINVDQALNSRKVTAQASQDVPTAFMGLVGVDFLRAATLAEAQERVVDIEISLALDVSSSMTDSNFNRMTNMRRAANEFVETVMPEEQDPNDISITTVSIVPYAMTVNLGRELIDLYNVPPIPAGQQRYSNCILFANEAFSSTALPPNRPLERYPHFDHHDYGYLSGSPLRVVSPLCPREAEPGGQESNLLLPLATDPDELIASIGALQPYTATGIEAGMRWAIAMLDPETRPVIDALVASGTVGRAAAGRPLDYDPERALKVAVLMTDGELDAQRDLAPEVKSGLSNVWYDPASHRYSVLVRGRFRKGFPYGSDDDDDDDDDDGCKEEIWDDRPIPNPADGVVRVAKGNQDDWCAPVWYWVSPDNDKRRQTLAWGDPVGSPQGEFHDHPYSRLRTKSNVRDRNNWGILDRELRRLTNREVFEHFTMRDSGHFLYHWPRQKGMLSNAEWNILNNPRRDTNSLDGAVARLQRLCTAAKAKGVVVFTIGFELDGIRGQRRTRAGARPDAELRDDDRPALLRREGRPDRRDVQDHRGPDRSPEAHAMSGRLRRWLGRFARDTRATATVEFVILFPAFVLVMTNVIEASVLMMRAAMIDRGLDMAVRELRLRPGDPPDAGEFLELVCAFAGSGSSAEVKLVPRCTETLRIELSEVDGDWTPLGETDSCVQDYDPGKDEALMMVRVCVVANPLLPHLGLGALLPKDASGGYRLIAVSAFVHEPEVLGTPVGMGM